MLKRQNYRTVKQLLVTLVILCGTQLSSKVVSATPELSEKDTVNLSENVPELISTTNSLNRDYYKVFIDPGHGGSDPGAVVGTVYEKTINLEIASKVEALLENQGVDIEMSRTTDMYVSLYNRAAKSNNYGADLFVSIHANAAPTSYTTGIESFHAPSSLEGKALATNIQKNLISYTGTRDRGVKSAYYSVVQDAKMPAVLIETGFMTNPIELNNLLTSSYQMTVARGIADGIYTYLIDNIPLKKGEVIATGEVINTDTLNVRSGASASYSKVGTLGRGQVVNILEVMNNGWYKIEYRDQVAYVSNAYIKRHTEAPTVIGTGEVINTNTLNVRSGASTSYCQIGSLKRGDKVNILAVMSNGWYQIQFNDQIGYVSNTYIDWSKETSTVIGVGEVVNTNTLNVRSGASTSHSQIGTLKRGDKVNILAVMSNGWYKIEYKDAIAYVSNAYIDQNKNTSTVIGTGEVVNTNTLNVRSGASTSHSQVGTLKRGDKVNIFAVMSNGWYKIEYKGDIAYVSNAYINWSKESSTVIKTGEVINADVLNVRSGASTSHSKIGSLKKGQKVEIVATHNGWHQIKYGSGYGYVFGTYIK